jgi:hypothetical protein
VSVQCPCDAIVGELHRIPFSETKNEFWWGLHVFQHVKDKNGRETTVFARKWRRAGRESDLLTELGVTWLADNYFGGANGRPNLDHDNNLRLHVTKR